MLDNMQVNCHSFGSLRLRIASAPKEIQADKNIPVISTNAVCSVIIRYHRLPTALPCPLHHLSGVAAGYILGRIQSSSSFSSGVIQSEQMRPSLAFRASLPYSARLPVTSGFPHRLQVVLINLNFCRRLISYRPFRILHTSGHWPSRRCICCCVSCRWNRRNPHAAPTQSSPSSVGR